MLRAFQSIHCRNLFSSLVEHIPTFARDSHFVQRISKHFCPKNFLLALLNAVSSGKSSLQQIVAQLSINNPDKCITAQALHERLHRTHIGAECFLVYCLSFLVSIKCSNPKSKCPFKRIIVEDSSQLALHPHNAEEFPGHGNHLGATAGCKIDICFDLLSGKTLCNSLHCATTQDKTIGVDLLDIIEKDDLILRDMGYFSIETFATIEQKNAYWLSRLPRSVSATTPAGPPLETLLQQADQDTLDIAIDIGKTAKHSARLIAKRCTIEESRKRRRELRKAYKSNGKTPTKAQLSRCDWHLMVTNISQEMQSSTEIHKLYQQRWQIEIAFRGWKKSHKLAELHKHKTSSTHIKILILASMILLTLTLQFVKEIQAMMSEKDRPYLSMEKVFEYISQWIAKIKTLAEMTLYLPSTSLLCGQKRLKKSLIHQQLISLA